MPESTSVSQSTRQVLDIIDHAVRKDFEVHQRILSFDEYLSVLAENASANLRGSSQYMLDMMDHFGKEKVEPYPGASTKQKHDVYHFKLFDHPIEGTDAQVIGHEEVQTKIYRSLTSFARQGANNKLILLHGPNGSAKTTLIHSLMHGLERYSESLEGALYRFNWIFPVESLTKSGIGFQAYDGQVTKGSDSYAKLSEDDISARFSCDLKDHPLLLIPKEHRLQVLESLIGESQARTLWEKLPQYFRSGELCHRCRLIFDALLNSNNGDYKNVLKHIQVERFYFSRRYRSGMVTVEPQLHVDATYQQLTMDKNLGALPPSLQGLNFFTLRGDLIDGNRGVIEYSDLLKRPVDTFKYLLIACETGAVNVNSSIAYLDTVMIGSSNELQLDAFKEFPDFGSFKARIELIRVPYLLSISKEKRIYDTWVNRVAGNEKAVSPHVTWSLALWAVLSRLKKPNSINYPPSISSLISNLTPLEKSKLYDSAEMPAGLSPEDRKLLKSNLYKLREEYNHIPYYEGRMGASAREIKSILFDAIQNPEFKCVSPIAVFAELEKFVKRVSEYDFLKQDVKDGYHDAAEFINTCRNVYLDIIDREVRASIGLYEPQQWEEFIRKYVNHLSHFLKKEKLFNPETQKSADPDVSLLKEFEEIVGAPKDKNELEAFQRNIISQVGAWSLDHPNQDVIYQNVFPEYWTKLEKHYYESQKSLVTKMRNALEVFGTDEYDKSSEGAQLARQTLDNMKAHYGYSEDGALEVIIFLMRKRY